MKSTTPLVVLAIIVAIVAVWQLKQSMGDKADDFFDAVQIVLFASVVIHFL